MKRVAFRSMSLALCLALWPGYAPGQTTAVTSDGSGNAREHLTLTLGPHRYTPLQNLPSPFVRTYLRTSVGLGRAFDLTIPLVTIDSITLVAVQGDLVIASLDFKYEHAVKDWFGVWANLRGLGRLGTGVGALLGEGISAALGFELGTIIRLYESRKILLSGTTQISNFDATVINLRDFVNGILDSGKVTPENPLVRTTPVLAGGAGLRMAWSLSPLLGLQGHGLVGLSESVTVGETTQWYYKFDGLLDFDLGAVGFIPVGLSTGYVQTDFGSQTGRAGELSHSALLAVSYRGRPDFAVGLEMTWDWLPSLLTDDTIKAGSVLIMSQYFF